MTMEPTPEQFAEWLTTAMEGKPMEYMHGKPGALAGDVARLAYAAGADAKLEACVDWMTENEYPFVGRQMKAALGRPKPISLNQQALDYLRRLACKGAIPDYMETMMLIHRIEDAINTIPDTTELQPGDTAPSTIDDRIDAMLTQHGNSYRQLVRHLLGAGEGTGTGEKSTRDHAAR